MAGEADRINGKQDVGGVASPFQEKLFLRNSGMFMRQGVLFECQALVVDDRCYGRVYARKVQI
jgi:hypothetical protein